MSRDLGALTSPQVAAAIVRSARALLPVGSIEQHGAHLPCATDTLAAELVAGALAERLDALVASLGVGASASALSGTLAPTATVAVGGAITTDVTAPPGSSESLLHEMSATRVATNHLFFDCPSVITSSKCAGSAPAAMTLGAPWSSA